MLVDDTVHIGILCCRLSLLQRDADIMCPAGALRRWEDHKIIASEEDCCKQVHALWCIEGSKHVKTICTRTRSYPGFIGRT